MEKQKPLLQRKFLEFQDYIENPELQRELNKQLHGSIAKVARNSIKNLFPGATFQIYTKCVGNWGEVTLVKTKEPNTYVMRVFISSQEAFAYLKRYHEVEIEEHRPALNMICLSFGKEARLSGSNLSKITLLDPFSTLISMSSFSPFPYRLENFSVY